jgi:MFS family permease
MAVMAVAPNQPSAFASGVLLGMASIAFLTASTAIVQIEAAPEMRGRVLALQAMLFLGSTPIGGPIVGWVSEQFGARYAIGLGAVAALGAGAWGMLQAQRAPAATVTEVILEPEVVAPVS